MKDLAVLRQERDIQRAHDILEAVQLGEIELRLSHDSKLALRLCLDTLCWVLGHDDNPTFADNLAALEGAAVRAGYVLKDRTQ